MIPKPVLKELVKERLKDAEALLYKRRYHASIYMSGYAIEIALKYKICKMYYFSKGFPENAGEFQSYYSTTKKSLRFLRQTIKHVKDIRHHDLPKLLFYSGDEYQIKQNLLNEWSMVISWNPEMRYKIASVRKKNANNNLNATKAIINEIL